jgi:hypothetical protein
MKEETPLDKPFYRGAKGWSADQGRWPAHVAIAPSLCTKVVVVELKRMLVEKKVGKGVGGRLATHFGWQDKPWPPPSPNFLHPPHLVPLVFKPLTQSTKSKAISLHSFQKFLLFIYFLIFFIL